MTVGQVILILIAAKIGISSIKKHITRPNRLRMELIKYSNTDNVEIVDLPDELYEVDESLVEDNPVYQKTYEEFAKRLVTIVDRKDLDNFYRNFATLKEIPLTTQYKLANLLLRGGIVGGGYDIKDNTIDLATNKLAKYMHSTIHELLHAASRYYDKETGIVYCGLSQCRPYKGDPKKTETFGLGLNEGCTQYFAIKYFTDFNNIIIASKIYSDEQKIIHFIEKIVGEEKLKSFYFRADLNGLVKELEKYASKEDIYKFINYTDVLCHYERDASLNFDKLNEVKFFINMFLIKAYNKAVELGDIERDDFVRPPYTLK